MARFFVDKIENDFVQISGSDSAHIIKSLRLKTGEEIILCDQRGYDYTAVIDGINAGTVVAKITGKEENKSEPNAEIILYQALPKSGKLDFIIQKSVELGVKKIVPMLTTYCVSRPKEKDMNAKLPRLSAISLEAAKQSGRGIVPEIAGMLEFKEAVDQMAEADTPIIFYEKANKKLSEHIKNIRINSKIGIMVGSEGGFSAEEIEYAAEKGILVASLGSRILRCETAPICGISAIMYQLGEF